MATRRRVLLALVISAVATPLGSIAQPSPRVWRIGFLDLGSRQSSMDLGRFAALRKGLADLGYAEGKQVMFEARFAGGDEEVLARLAAELATLRVSVIVSFGALATIAAQFATTEIPIVGVSFGDPVGHGLADSLAHPGGNMTGLTNGGPALSQKQLEFLIGVQPSITRVAVLLNRSNAFSASGLRLVRIAADALGKTVFPVALGSSDNIERVFSERVHGQADAIIILPDAYLSQMARRIAALATKYRLPSAAQASALAEAGILVTYGADSNDLLYRSASLIDKILKGAKAGDIPFQEPMRYQFILNKKTARDIGLTFPQSILVRADRVID